MVLVLGGWWSELCKLFMKAARLVRRSVMTVLSGSERNEDHKVKLDICERQAAVVCGVNEAYDGGVGALERRDECRPSQPPVLRAWVGGPARRGHAHAASDCVGGGER